jgi:Protein of unknown function (DUF3574)
MDQSKKATLYLGANIKGEYGVTETEFSLWLDDHVTPTFPGFTRVRETFGYWKGKPEVSRELVILGEISSEFKEQVRVIAESYKSRFKQEAVIVTFETVDILWDVL